MMVENLTLNLILWVQMRSHNLYAVCSVILREIMKKLAFYKKMYPGILTIQNLIFYELFSPALFQL